MPTSLDDIVIDRIKAQMSICDQIAAEPAGRLFAPILYRKRARSISKMCIYVTEENIYDAISVVLIERFSRLSHFACRNDKRSKDIIDVEETSCDVKYQRHYRKKFIINLTDTMNYSVFFRALFSRIRRVSELQCCCTSSSLLEGIYLALAECRSCEIRGLVCKQDMAKKQAELILICSASLRTFEFVGQWIEWSGIENLKNCVKLRELTVSKLDMKTADLLSSLLSAVNVRCINIYEPYVDSNGWFFNVFSQSSKIKKLSIGGSYATRREWVQEISSDRCRKVLEGLHSLELSILSDDGAAGGMSVVNVSIGPTRQDLIALAGLLKADSVFIVRRHFKSSPAASSISVNNVAALIRFWLEFSNEASRIVKLYIFNFDKQIDKIDRCRLRTMLEQSCHNLKKLGCVVTLLPSVNNPENVCVLLDSQNK